MCWLDSWEVVEVVVEVFVVVVVMVEWVGDDGGYGGGAWWFQRWQTGGGLLRWFLKILSTWNVKLRKNVLL